MHDPSESHILVADDSMIMRRILIKLLSDLGYEIFSEAADGEAALEIIRDGDVDLVLCDYKMPKLNGHQVLNKVRKELKKIALPFIMVTSESEISIVERCIKSGVSDYLVKPYDHALLREKLDSIFSRQNIPMEEVDEIE